jgi:23S rRNA pseudouridine1911/1915/1917 synthase
VAGGGAPLQAPGRVYEDDALIALCKPAGLPVLSPTGEAEGACLAAWLLEQEPARRALAFPPGFGAGALHRLDTSTSGLVLFARRPADFAALRALFSGHQLTKRYLLIAVRSAAWEEREIDAPIAHHPQKRDRMVVQRGPGTAARGRWLPAQTRLQRRGAGPDASGVDTPTLFSAEIRTGVMHQIRAHAGFAGVPLLGDRRYGGGATPPDAPPGVEFFLHHAEVRGPRLAVPPVPPPPGWPLCAAAGAMA